MALVHIALINWSCTGTSTIRYMNQFQFYKVHGDAQFYLNMARNLIQFFWKHLLCTDENCSRSLHLHSAVPQSRTVSDHVGYLCDRAGLLLRPVGALKDWERWRALDKPVHEADVVPVGVDPLNYLSTVLCALMETPCTATISTSTVGTLPIMEYLSVSTTEERESLAKVIPSRPLHQDLAPGGVVI